MIYIPLHKFTLSIGIDDAGKARRLKLRDMTREVFSDGKIPDPRSHIPELSQQSSARHLKA